MLRFDLGTIQALFRSGIIRDLSRFLASPWKVLAIWAFAYYILDVHLGMKNNSLTFLILMTIYFAYALGSPYDLPHLPCLPPACQENPQHG
ncbi:hypothetical protein O181_019136 [Austropuccinia psidii MF-1]|uniref:Uncharacterized protein n=1 Tax=Austropuccinia psidii MF-1 TaxID=1389203 RepID=A0A9Q3CAX9_9BASI|nr:hypothetical protein [Austropuccinia psidii MF-1]